MGNTKSAWTRTSDGEAKGEATLVILKPDAVARGLIGEIVGRLERKGLEILAMRMHPISKAEAVALYSEHEGKLFFDSLVGFTVSGPSVLMVVRGNNAIDVVRAMMGATDCAKAAPGTIRGDLGITSFEKTLVHASRTPQDFDREWHIFEWHGDAHRLPYRSDRGSAYSEMDE